MTHAAVEPVRALDPASGAALMETLRRIGTGRTVVRVTHQLRDAMHAHRICVFLRGRVVEAASDLRRSVPA